MREVAKVKKKYWFQYFLVFITLSFALISPVGHAEDVIFEPFVGELSVSGSMIAGKTVLRCFMWVARRLTFRQ